MQQTSILGRPLLQFAMMCPVAVVSHGVGFGPAVPIRLRQLGYSLQRGWSG